MLFYQTPPQKLSHTVYVQSTLLNTELKMCIWLECGWFTHCENPALDMTSFKYTYNMAFLQTL